MIIGKYKTYEPRHEKTNVLVSDLVINCQNNLYTVDLFILMPDPEPLLTGLARRPVPDSETQSLGIRYRTPRPWVLESGTGPRDTSLLKRDVITANNFEPLFVLGCMSWSTISASWVQNQNQNSLLVKRQNDNTSPGDWPRKISP